MTPHEPQPLLSLNEDDDDCKSGHRKSSVASSSMTKASTLVFHKAIEQDAKTVERSLVFLRRALYVVSASIVVAALVILAVDDSSLIGATSEAAALYSEGDHTALHSVRGHTTGGVGCGQCGRAG